MLAVRRFVDVVNQVRCVLAGLAWLRNANAALVADLTWRRQS